MQRTNRSSAKLFLLFAEDTGRLSIRQNQQDKLLTEMNEGNHMRSTNFKKKNRNLQRAVAVLACCVLVLGVGGFAAFHFLSAKDAVPASAQQKVEEKTITIGNAGDVIIHSPFYKGSTYKKDGDYDFTSCFSNVKEDYEANDFMVLNLETTLPGKDVGYSGYPMFKSPDSLVDSLTSSGVDLMLLANNHIYDSGVNGFLRTSQLLQDKGVLYTGARHSEEEKKYLVQEIDGVKVGFVNYVYETPRSDDRKGINGNPLDPSVAPLLNSFDPNDLDSFYTEMENILSDMKKDGAEFVIAYPHWGNEYQLQETGWQRDIAQKLCDMGVDAIVGGHPHVVQPVDVFTSEDGKHKMFCAFSVGNQLSNQRREIMNLSTGNTEDGLIIDLTITRDSKGKAALTGIKYIPTWVYKTGGPVYSIIPADDPATVEETTGIKGIKSQVQASYDRTYKIIGDGVKKVNEAYGF